MGLFGALTNATRSLDTFTAGIQVAGQNIANAATPGYVRESLVIEPGSPYQSGQLLFGTGARATGIRQNLDEYLESRLHSANGNAEAAESRSAIYREIEGMLVAFGDGDLSTSLNSFVAQLDEVATQPEDASLRQLAIQRGVELSARIQRFRGDLEDLRVSISQNVDGLAEEANRLIDEIERLNPQITKLESAGLLRSDAGGLRSQRLEAVNRLSEIIPVHVIERTSGAIDVFAGNDFLVLSGQKQHLQTVDSTDPEHPGPVIQLSQTEAPLLPGDGQLNGLISARDEVLSGFVGNLNQFTSELIRTVNELHSSGEGTKGYTSITGGNAVSDAALSLNDAGLAFTPRHGAFDVKVVNTTTGLTTTKRIAVDLDGIGTETSLSDLQLALDGVDHLSASITADGRLSLSTENGYELRFGNDTSGTLAALGVNTFFSGDDSVNIAVNSLLVSDARYLATGTGGGPADGSNAIKLAGLLNKGIESLGGRKLDQFYTNVVSSFAESSAAETALYEGLDGFRESLQAQRAQRSGVSIDEEAVQLMQYQQAYQATARLISTIDELFDTLLRI